jgi:hypothetical protein
VKQWRSDKLQGKPSALREKYSALPFLNHTSQMNCCGALWQEASKPPPELQHYLLAPLPVFKLEVNNPFYLLIIFQLCMYGSVKRKGQLSLRKVRKKNIWLDTHTAEILHCNSYKR